MTTELKGKDTFFLPFNMGSNGAGNVGGAGNPVNEDGYAIAAIMKRLKDWEKTDVRKRIPAYGQQRVYIRKKE